MLAFAGKSERGLRRFVLGVRPALVRGVTTAVAAAVGIGAQRGTFAVFGLFDRFFALLHLVGEGGLGRRLRVLWGLLGRANLGRVLRGGQVCQLQVRGTDRHAQLFPLAASVLLYFRRPRGSARASASIFA